MKLIIKTAIYISITLLGIYPAFGQISIGGLPYSFTAKNYNDAVVPTTLMPPIDVNKLLKEDEVESKNGLPWRFGKDIDVNLNLSNSGVWVNLPTGDRIWKLNIASLNALSINLIYNDFYLPDGATLYIYSSNKSHVIGGFTSRNNRTDKKFATSLVKGASCVLEYYEPKSEQGKGRINISKVIHGYRDLYNKAEKDYGDSGPCNINVNCSEGANWQHDKRSVAMILLANNSRLCTGAVINNNNQDGTPYFLTANHCHIGDPGTWLFMFNYESPGCTNQDGPTNQTVSGSVVRAKNSDSDVMLVELSSVPPVGYNIYYSGWTNQNIAATNSVAIHHPSGDIKKISFDNNPPTSSDYDPSPYLADSHWEIQQWDNGTTEGGSSGSPLYDQNHRITGQLHGGWASCSSLTEDYYGKFSMSWNRGTLASTRLIDWLDPNNLGTPTLNGTYITACISNITITLPINNNQTHRAANHIYASNTIASSASATYQAGASVNLQPGFSYTAGANQVFIARIQSCTVFSPENVTLTANDEKWNGNTAAINLYPNPSNGNFMIDIKYSSEKNVQLSIYNMLGQKIYYQHLGKIAEAHLPLNVNENREGFYILKIQADDAIETRQIAVIK